MRGLTRLEAAAVKGKRVRLEECLELFGNQGRVLVDPSVTELVNLGFCVREVRKVQRLRAALKVLQNFKPVRQQRFEDWAKRDEELRNARLGGTVDQAVLERDERIEDSIWEAYLVEC